MDIPDYSPHRKEDLRYQRKPYQVRKKSDLDEFLEIINPKDIYKTIYATVEMFERFMDDAKKELGRQEKIKNGSN